MSSERRVIRVCFVCLGNICRSPTAEAVMRLLVERAGLSAVIAVESAGTGDWHVGHPPDPRTRLAGERRGLRFAGRARQVSGRDFSRCDYLVALDLKNESALRALAPDERAASKIHLLRDFAPGGEKRLEVPDPYYGGEDGFGLVIDQCFAACEGLLATLVERHSLPTPAADPRILAPEPTERDA